MRTIHTTLACGLLVLAAAPVALTHCSGSTASSPKSDAGKGGSSSGFSSGGGNSSGGSSSGSSGDDGGGSSSGASSSGGQGGDGGNQNTDGGSSGGGDGGGSSSGGSTTPVPEGGMPSDPGVVPCGSATCSAASQKCCATADAGTCTALNSGCPTGSTSHECKEAADCASGNVCCTVYNYGSYPYTCNLGGCPTGDYQVCRTDAECGSPEAGAGSQKCVVQTCHTTGPTGPTVTVEACAVRQATGGPGGGIPGGGTGGTWGALTGCTAN